jgi:hypothetical protein
MPYNDYICQAIKLLYAATSKIIKAAKSQCLPLALFKGKQRSCQDNQ